MLFNFLNETSEGFHGFGTRSEGTGRRRWELWQENSERVRGRSRQHRQTGVSRGGGAAAVPLTRVGRRTRRVKLQSLEISKGFIPEGKKFEKAETMFQKF
ncbi:hypothetical protein F2Q69_00036555 [Brassica cretica]|uniref:Uncharacterized protein n=1 Tax=Brassica cretica TaxID=69181 RepID=A0A8S9SC85_BRACR|nr:hypothetical protein F2Q69_00036555 [Brassica cretica]